MAKQTSTYNNELILNNGDDVAAAGETSKAQGRAALFAVEPLAAALTAPIEQYLSSLRNRLARVGAVSGRNIKLAAAAQHYAGCVLYALPAHCFCRSSI